MIPSPRTLSAALALVSLLACSKDDPAKGGMTAGGASAIVNASVPQESKDIFAQRCVTCHGPSGRGDGVVAASMMPKPRDFTDKVWQGGVMDQKLAETIVRGGAAIGKSPLMTANPDLQGKPEVVAGLVQIVRNFGK